MAQLHLTFLEEQIRPNILEGFKSTHDKLGSEAELLDSNEHAQDLYKIWKKLRVIVDESSPLPKRRAGISAGKITFTL